MPFTYYLFHRPTGAKYYGVRYARDCHPSDLWTVYFSSSHRVKALIEQFGADSFDVEIRKTFETAESAIAWEKQVLRRLKVLKRNDWLNDSICGMKYAMTDEIRQKISLSGRGVKRTAETRVRMSKAQKGRIITESHREKMIASHKGMSGRKHSAETRLKMSEAAKRRYSTLV